MQIGNRGARWHAAKEIRSLFAGLPVGELTLSCAVFLPGGGIAARTLELLTPACLPLGALLVAAGTAVGPCLDRQLHETGG